MIGAISRVERSLYWRLCSPLTPDGMANLKEWTADTNPMEALSALKMFRSAGPGVIRSRA